MDTDTIPPRACPDCGARCREVTSCVVCLDYRCGSQYMCAAADMGRPQGHYQSEACVEIGTWGRDHQGHHETNLRYWQRTCLKCIEAQKQGVRLCGDHEDGSND